MRDIWGNKRRTFLVVLSIASGVFAVGTVAQMQVIVSKDMVESYEAANPASATIYTDQPFDDDVVEAVRRMPEVAEADVHDGQINPVDLELLSQFRLQGLQQCAEDGYRVPAIFSQETFPTGQVAVDEKARVGDTGHCSATAHQ